MSIVGVGDALGICINSRTEQPVQGRFPAIVLCDQYQQMSERTLCVPVMWFGQTLYLGTRHVTDNMAPLFDLRVF